MSDTNIRDDEEYNYPQEEYVVEGSKQTHQEEAEEKIKRGSNVALFIKRNKRKLGVVVLAIIAIVAFQVMNYEKNNKVITVTPAPVKKVVPNQANASHNMIVQELSGLQQTGSANSVTISKLQSRLKDMKSQLDQANETDEQLRQAMLLLLSELKKVNTHLEAPKPVKKPQGPQAPEVVYHIRAMVENRAWLVGSNGLTESVTVGDPIPDYGLVKKVDANKGIITTTSGKIIKLGFNDY